MGAEEDKVSSRAEALPEETGQAAADEPQSQAAAILDESEKRTQDPATTDLTDDSVERRRSDELTPDEHVMPDTGP